MQDLNEYLPLTTMQWYHETLQATEFSLLITAGTANNKGDYIYYQIYKHLRKTAQCHIIQKQLLYLCFSNKPTGAYTWQHSELVAGGVGSMQFKNEGLDTLIQDKDYEDIRIPGKPSTLFFYLYF